MNSNQMKVRRSFERLEPKLGYNYLLWGAKHFGFYPNGIRDISEKEAQNLHHERLAEELNLKSGEVILDAGCGQGVVSAYLAKKYGANIYGITLVPFEVDEARKLAIKHGVSDKINYQVMDYSETAFPDNYFDAVYTTETLSHSPDIRKTLKEFYRILKPDGRIALFEYTMAPDNEFNGWEKKMFDVVVDGAAMLGLRDFRHGRFLEIIKEAGFQDANEQNITQYVLPSFYRLYRIFYVPYKSVIKPLRLQKSFPYITAMYEFYKMAEKDLFRYLIFTAKKL